jgi:hypothetical protein
MGYGLNTYPDLSRREDLLDILKNIAPDRTPIAGMMSADTSRGLKRIQEMERKKWVNRSTQLIRKWMKIDTES